MNLIDTLTQVPIVTTLQHCLDAFIVIAPVVGLIGLTLVLTQNK